MTLQAIRKVNFPMAPTPAREKGAVPELAWLLLSQLRISEDYQREILKSGLANVRKIVEEFRWTRFAPLVVARRPGGLYAIVDGQHRAAAALYLGIERVPCQIITCDIEEEARAFAAINGNVTKLSPLQVFHARLVAGDRRAKMIQAAFTAAGVRVPRNIQACDKPGMTLAIGTLQVVFTKYGADTLTLALRLVVETGDGNAGLLRSAIIAGLADMLAEDPALARHHVKLKAGIEAAGIPKLYQKALRIQSLDGGPLRRHFAQVARKALEAA